MAAVDLRYARALDAVVSEHRLDRVSVQNQLASFATALQGSADLREVLENPSIPELQKLRLLDSIAGKLALDKVVRNFIALVASHNRLNEFAALQAAYAALVDEAGNVVEVEVSSASVLTDATKAQLESQIAKLTDGQKIQPTYTQDPSLLGGAVVRIGSKVYDGSVKAQLQQLKQSLVSSLA